MIAKLTNGSTGKCPLKFYGTNKLSLRKIKAICAWSVLAKNFMQVRIAKVKIVIIKDLKIISDFHPKHSFWETKARLIWFMIGRQETTCLAVLYLLMTDSRSYGLRWILIFICLLNRFRRASRVCMSLENKTRGNSRILLKATIASAFSIRSMPLRIKK